MRADDIAALVGAHIQAIYTDDPRTPQSGNDLAEAIAAFAEDCRRAYHERFTQPVPYVLHPDDYDIVTRAVEDGTAPDWVAAMLHTGRLAPAQRLGSDGGRP